MPQVSIDIDKLASASWFEFRARRLLKQKPKKTRPKISGREFIKQRKSARKRRLLRAFMVDVLHNHLDLDTAKDIADELVARFPSFEIICDPRKGGISEIYNALRKRGMKYPDITEFVDILQEENEAKIRRG